MCYCIETQLSLLNKVITIPYNKLALTFFLHSQETEFVSSYLAYF